MRLVLVGVVVAVAGCSNFDQAVERCQAESRCEGRICTAETEYFCGSQMKCLGGQCRFPTGAGGGFQTGGGSVSGGGLQTGGGGGAETGGGTGGGIPDLSVEAGEPCVDSDDCADSLFCTGSRCEANCVGAEDSCMSRNAPVCRLINDTAGFCSCSESTCGAAEFCGAHGHCTPGCATDDDCEPSRSCDVMTHRCEGSECNPYQFQPTNCGYGAFCGETRTCLSIAKPTCENFRMGSSPAVWSTTSTGPVITEVIVGSPLEDPTYCGSGNDIKRMRLLVRAYDPQSRLTSSVVQPTLLGYLPDGTTSDQSDSIGRYASSNGGQNAEFVINMCTQQGPNLNFTFGLAFAGGNGVCVHISP